MWSEIEKKGSTQKWFVNVNSVCMLLFISLISPREYFRAFYIEKNAAYTLNYAAARRENKPYTMKNHQRWHHTLNLFKLRLCTVWLSFIFALWWWWWWWCMCLVSSQFKILFWLKYEREMFILDITTISRSASETNHTVDHSVKRNKIDRMMMLTMQCTVHTHT